MLIGKKGWGKPNWKWKARFEARGDLVRDAAGLIVREAMEHKVPAHLAAVRLAFALSLMFHDGIVLGGDVAGAYLDADLDGPPYVPRARVGSDAR